MLGLPINPCKRHNILPPEARMEGDIVFLINSKYGESCPCLRCTVLSSVIIGSLHVKLELINLVFKVLNRIEPAKSLCFQYISGALVLGFRLK